VVENPSAGKFGPPPENARRERERLGIAPAWRAGLGVVALTLAFIGLKYLARTRSGWTAGLSAVLLVVLGGVQYVVNRKQRERDGGPEPFSKPTNITR
jgi:hypothetical protein